MPVDWLAAAGVIDRFIGAAVSMEQFGLCQQYRKGVEEGRIRVEELSETSLNARLGAGARNLPFLPTRGLIGTDLIDQNENLTLFQDPFGGETLVACRALVPDVALVHAHRADEHGQRPVRAHDPLARPRDLPEGREEGDRHCRGDRRLRRAAAQPRPDGAPGLPRRRGRRGPLRRPPDVVLPLYGYDTRFHVEWAKVSATTRRRRTFLAATCSSRRHRRTTSTPSAASSPADGGDSRDVRRTTRSTRSCA